MLPRVVRDLYSIQLQALVAFANVVNSGDVGAHFIHNLHQLKDKINERFWMVIAAGLKKKDKKQCSPKDSYFHSLSPQHPLLPIALLLYLCLEHLSGPLFTRIIPAFPARTYPLTISSKEKLLAIACPGPVLLGHLIILYYSNNLLLHTECLCPSAENKSTQ